MQDIVQGNANDEAIEGLADFVEKVDGTYEALKDLESGINTAAETQGVKGNSPINEAPEALGLDADLTNTLKSDASDLYAIAKEIKDAGGVKALKEAGKLKDVLKNGGFAAIGQMAGRHLKAISEGKM